MEISDVRSYKEKWYLFWSSVGEKHDGRLAIRKTKCECMRNRAQFLEPFVPFLDAWSCALEHDYVRGDIINVLCVLSPSETVPLCAKKKKDLLTFSRL